MNGNLLCLKALVSIALEIIYFSRVGSMVKCHFPCLWALKYLFSALSSTIYNLARLGPLKLNAMSI